MFALRVKQSHKQNNTKGIILGLRYRDSEHVDWIVYALLSIRRGTPSSESLIRLLISTIIPAKLELTRLRSIGRTSRLHFSTKWRNSLPRMIISMFLLWVMIWVLCLSHVKIWIRKRRRECVCVPNRQRSSGMNVSGFSRSSSLVSFLTRIMGPSSYIHTA